MLGAAQSKDCTQAQAKGKCRPAPHTPRPLMTNVLPSLCPPTLAQCGEGGVARQPPASCTSKGLRGPRPIASVTAVWPTPRQTRAHHHAAAPMLTLHVGVPNLGHRHNPGNAHVRVRQQRVSSMHARKHAYMHARTYSQIRACRPTSTRCTRTCDFYTACTRVHTSTRTLTRMHPVAHAPSHACILVHAQVCKHM